MQRRLGRCRKNSFGQCNVTRFYTIFIALYLLFLYSFNSPLHKGIPYYINCASLINGNWEEIIKAEQYQKVYQKYPVTERYYMELTRNCNEFKSRHGYITHPVTQEEADFPLAFSIVVYKDIEQIERLLRAIYRPQNYYCIHMDKKSPKQLHQAVRAISSCFDNVFIASKIINVEWALFSVLEVELICMEELFRTSSKWKYFINLTGQEFPLKTNLALVQILKAFNGSNNIQGTTKGLRMNRITYVHKGKYQTSKLKELPPGGVRLTKGGLQIAATRAFVDFVLHNKTAVQLKEWVKDTLHPDETYFTSLNHNPQLGVPGAYKGEPEISSKYPLLTRFINWDDGLYACHGKYVREVCIHGVGDLTTFANRPEMFVNKFHLKFHPLALDCLEQLHFNRTQEEINKISTFNVSYYRQFDFVRNHV